MRSDDLGTESDGSASIGSFTVNTLTGLMSRHCPKMRLPIMDTTNNESVISVLDLSQMILYIFAIHKSKQNYATYI